MSFLRKQLQDEEEILRGVQRDLLHIETKSVGVSQISVVPMIDYNRSSVTFAYCD